PQIEQRLFCHGDLLGCAGMVTRRLAAGKPRRTVVAGLAPSPRPSPPATGGEGAATSRHGAQAKPTVGPCSGLGRAVAPRRRLTGPSPLCETDTSRGGDAGWKDQPQAMGGTG